MIIEVKVPPLSESVAEATLLAWHKKQGEAVKRDENLIDIETDKVVLELPAPADGVLFLDLETTGLAGGAGTYAFLVGCGWFDDTSFRLRQFFLPSAAAESALLTSLASTHRAWAVPPLTALPSRWLFLGRNGVNS